MNKFTVYIIQSQEGYIYTGSTSDLNKRLLQHNNVVEEWSSTAKGIFGKLKETGNYK